MLSSKSGLLAALSLGLIGGAAPVMLADTGAPDKAVMGPGPRRHIRSRVPFGNTVRYHGQHYHTGTAIVAGVPGAKLARKAAEGRLGLPRGVRGVIINAK